MALDLIRLNRNVRAEMSRAGITQIGLADQLGIHQTALSRRLNGATPWTVDELYQLADTLGVPLSALLPAEAAAS